MDLKSYRPKSGSAQQFIEQITDELTNYVANNKDRDGKPVVAPDVTEAELIQIIKKSKGLQRKDPEP